jgi:hypothetical protein
MKDIQKIKEFFSQPVNETKETAIDKIKKQLDALGVKYEMSTTDKVRPFKVIYRPINKSDEFYDKFEDIVDLFNFKGVVKPSMNEAKEEDAVDTITMDVPLFIRMLEYAREDASQDMDLHDVTEKANKLGKERGILSMEDYEEIVGAAKDAPKGEMKEMDYGSILMRNLMPGADVLEKYANTLIMDPKIASASTEQEFRGLLRDKIEKAQWFGKDEVSKAAEYVLSSDNNAGKYSNTITRVFNMVKGKSVNEAELTEAYVPSNIKEFAKRKGVSALVNKVAGWAERVGKGIRGGTAIGKDYSTLILDMGYQTADIYINTEDETIELYGEEVNSFPEFQRVYLDNKEEDNSLEERISEALNKINEELCPAGKAYIKKRKTAGEKSSAYLSGRAVKVCKGQMSGKAKKK